MSISIFGYSIRTPFGFVLPKKSAPPAVQSFVPATPTGAATTVEYGTGAGYFNRMLSFEDQITSEVDLVNRYRTMAQHPDVDYAIQDIVNGIITQEDGKDSCRLILDDLPYSDEVKEKFKENWKIVLRLLAWKSRAPEKVRNQYVDGKIYHHILVDPNTPEAGIQELRFIDPRQIKKVRFVKKTVNPGNLLTIVQSTDEYYLYNERGIMSPESTDGVVISVDSVNCCDSGVYSTSNEYALSHLHKAMIALNLLKMMEQAVVIYRIVRAPERRVFYIDTGDLPPTRARQFLEEVVNQYRQKMSFNTATGEVVGDNRVQTMQEDFFVARQNGQKGTEVTTLDGGKGLGEMEEVDYFLKKLCKALNIPPSRFDSTSSLNFGRGQEISRDEDRFSKFINEIRSRIARMLLLDLLRVQLILKNVTCQEDWDEIVDLLRVEWLSDSYYAEMREQEKVLSRMEVFEKVAPLIGKYYSNETVRKTILKQTDEDIKREDELIEKEKADPSYQDTTPDIGDVAAVNKGERSFATPTEDTEDGFDPEDSYIALQDVADALDDDGLPQMLEESISNK